MGLPNDLKDYRAPLGIFQLIPPDRALFLLIVGGFVGYVFARFL